MRFGGENGEERYEKRRKNITSPYGIYNQFEMVYSCRFFGYLCAFFLEKIQIRGEKREKIGKNSVLSCKNCD